MGKDWRYEVNIVSNCIRLSLELDRARWVAFLIDGSCMKKKPRYRAMRKPKPTPDDLIYENTFQAAIIQAALLHRYKTYHMYDSRLCSEGSNGFPDTLIVGHGSLFTWELKTTTGVASDEQKEWLAAFDQVIYKPDARIIRPGDLDWCLDTLRRGALG